MRPCSTSVRIVRLAVVATLVGLGGCAETEFAAQTAKNLGRIEAPRGVKIGAPYEINGVWYEPHADYAYDREGEASWYGGHFHGRRTASGEPYNMNALTAAHPTLPMPSIVRVTNLENGRSLDLRVNDRGPFVEGRIIDVSKRAAEMLGFKGQGVTRVRVRVLAEESLIAQGQDPERLRSTSGPAPTFETAAASTFAALPEPLPEPAAAPAPFASVPETIPDPVAALEVAALSEPIAEPAAGPEAVSLPDRDDAAAAFVRYTPSGTWIQAGAFSAYPRAEAVRSRLSDVGPVVISAVVLGDAEFYRVRVGPADTHAAAQELLAQVVRAGYPESRIVIE
jgi:rare lipoprotein A